jgi:hypothetical protein
MIVQKSAHLRKFPRLRFEKERVSAEEKCRKRTEFRHKSVVELYGVAKMRTSNSEVTMTPFRMFASSVAIFVAATATFAQGDSLALSTMCETGDSSNLAVAVHLRARIGKPAAGHEYVFRYQIRLHTKAGEIGPLLGASSHPDGIAFDLGPLVRPNNAGWMLNTPSAPATSKEMVEAAAKTLEFDGMVDITRKELSGMTNLPKNSTKAIVRVEPQIYDTTDRKFVTAVKTNAALLFLETGSTGQVWAVRTFQEWFPQEFGTIESAKAAVRVLNDVDAWDRHNAVIIGFQRVFANKRIKPDAMAVAVRAVPAELIYSKNALPSLLATLAESDDAELKSAALARLAEYKKEYQGKR